jgi:hypothetical protein
VGQCTRTRYLSPELRSSLFGFLNTLGLPRIYFSPEPSPRQANELVDEAAFVRFWAFVTGRNEIFVSKAQNQGYAKGESDVSFRSKAIDPTGSRCRPKT